MQMKVMTLFITLLILLSCTKEKSVEPLVTNQPPRVSIVSPDSTGTLYYLGSFSGYFNFTLSMDDPDNNFKSCVVSLNSDSLYTHYNYLTGFCVGTSLLDSDKFKFTVEAFDKEGLSTRISANYKTENVILWQKDLTDYSTSLCKVIELSDNSLVLSQSEKLFKYDNQGNLLAQKNTGLHFKSIEKTLDNKIAAIDYESNSLYLYDADFNSIWQKDLDSIYMDLRVIPMEYGNFLVYYVLGNSYRVKKLDKYGNQMWERFWTYDGVDRIYCLATIAVDGNIFLCSYNNKTLNLNKISTNGDIIWQRFVSIDDLYSINSIQSDNIGGVIVAGTTISNSNSRIINLDKDGNIEWNVVHPFGRPVNIKKTQNGNYLILQQVWEWSPDGGSSILEINSQGEFVRKINVNYDAIKTFTSLSDGSLFLFLFDDSGSSETGNYIIKTKAVFKK